MSSHIQPGEDVVTREELQVLISKIQSQEARIQSLEAELKSKQGVYFCIILWPYINKYSV